MTVEAALAQAGFVPSALCHLSSDEAEIYGGAQALLLSPAPDFWPHVIAHTAHNPSIDNYSNHAINTIAKAHGLQTAFPFERGPDGGYVPFYSWALRSGSCFASPLGLLVHPAYGLMVSFRGALIGENFTPLPTPARSPCETCVKKPCTDSCPITALSPQGYDVSACREHIQADDSGLCMQLGCRARRSCPHSPVESRPQAHITHLMSEFANGA